MQNFTLRDKRRRHLPPAPRGSIGRRTVRWLVVAAAIAVAGLVALPGAFAAEASSVQVEGQKLDGATKVAGTELQLNGAGVRAWTIYKAYVGALYLPKKATSLPDVVSQSGPKRVQLRLLATVPGSSGYLADAFAGGIRKRVSADEYGVLKERIDTFDKMVRTLETKKNDVIDLDYVPGTGLVMSLNGKAIGAPLPGADLYDAMLKIWIGDDARDKPLRAAMLGGAS